MPVFVCKHVNTHILLARCRTQSLSTGCLFSYFYGCICMYVYMCMYVCIYVYTYKLYVCTYLYVSYMYVCIGMYAYRCIYIIGTMPRSSVLTHSICTCTCTHLYLCTCIYTCSFCRYICIHLSFHMRQNAAQCGTILRLSGFMNLHISNLCVEFSMYQIYIHVWHSRYSTRAVLQYAYIKFNICMYQIYVYIKFRVIRGHIAALERFQR